MADELPILASDAERDHSVVLLRDAVTSGRLTLEEFSDRVGRAQGARTDRDLAADPGRRAGRNAIRALGRGRAS